MQREGHKFSVLAGSQPIFSIEKNNQIRDVDETM